MKFGYFLLCGMLRSAAVSVLCMQACVAAQHLQEKRRLRAYARPPPSRPSRRKRSIRTCSRLGNPITVHGNAGPIHAAAAQGSTPSRLGVPDAGPDQARPTALTTASLFPFPGPSCFLFLFQLSAAVQLSSRSRAYRVLDTFLRGSQSCGIVETHLTHLLHWSKHPVSAEIFTLIFSFFPGPQLQVSSFQATPKIKPRGVGQPVPMTTTRAS